MDDKLKVGDKIYLIDSYNVMEFEVTDLYFDEEDNEYKARVLSDTLTFSLLYSVASTFTKDKDTANAQLTKEIFDHVNNTISSTTNNLFNNYYELEEAVKKYSETNPEIFI